ncbi:single-stranded DNA-binding protein [Streptomyces sp. NPDC007355]|uniref:single-stranded DNA-binding protein n=1 Tax=Streptomyces sp. NPDC007355 TaxID=3364778 RepID=UPI00369BB00C
MCPGQRAGAVILARRQRGWAAVTASGCDRETNAWRGREPTFLDCSCWRQPAENTAGSLTKGARVVAGRLRTDRWETPEGRPG